MSCVGLYGVLGYFVTERTPEIGIRRSLGARRATIVTMVLRQTSIPVSIGLVTGQVVAFGGSRYLASLLFGVQPRDAISFVSATAFIVVIAVAATILPAWRAARVDPIVALRSE